MSIQSKYVLQNGILVRNGIVDSTSGFTFSANGTTVGQLTSAGLRVGSASSNLIRSDSTGSIFFDADPGNTVASSAVVFTVDGDEKARLTTAQFAVPKLLVTTTAIDAISVQTTNAASRLSFTDSTTTTAPKIGSLANALILETSGLERVQVDSSGNVGVGITPTYKLTVNGDVDFLNGVIRRNGTAIIKSTGTETMIGPGGNGIVTFHKSSTMTSGDETVRIDSSGNMGVGGIPVAKLSVSDGTTAQLNISPESGTVVVAAKNNTNTGFVSAIYDGEQHIWRNSGSEVGRFDTSGSFGVNVTDPSTFGKIAVKGSFAHVVGSNGTTATPLEEPILRSLGQTGLYPAGLYSVNTFGSNSAHSLNFKVTNAAGTLIDAMAINSDGSVDLKTTTTMKSGKTLVLSNTADTATSSLSFATGDLITSIGANEAMRINSLRYVGINVTNPLSHLHVGGDIQLENATYVKGRKADSTRTRILGVNQFDVMYLGGVDTTLSGLAIVNNGTSMAEFNSGGVLGIGVTPETWESPRKVLRIGATGSINIHAASNAVQLTNNFTNPDGTNRNILAGYVMRYAQDIVSGEHFWQNTASSIATAGTAVTLNTQMLLDSSGNLCIGNTSSGGNKLRVTGGNVHVDSGSNYTANTGGGYWASGTGSYATGWYESGGGMIFRTNTTERLRIDSAGNLGLGVVPSAWRAVTKAVQVNLSTLADVAGGAGTVVGNNWYENTAANDAYIINDQASIYYQVSGEHRWYSAPAGTAGSTINWTPSMTLTYTGELGINTTSPDCKLSVDGNIRVGSVSTTPAFKGLILAGSVTDTFTVDTDKVIHHYGITAKEFSDQAGAPTVVLSGYPGIRFYTNGSERFRIDNPGNIGLGTKPSPWGGSHRAMDIMSWGTVGVNGGNNSLIQAHNVYINSAGNWILKNSAAGSIATQLGGDHTWYTVASGTAGSNGAVTAQASLTAGGNFGVGTTAPTQRFEVVDTVDVAGQIRTTGTANSAFLSLVSGNGTTSGRYSYVRFFNSDTVGQQWRMGTYGDNNFTIRDHSVGASRIVIDTSGNVGVGQNPTTFNKFSTSASVGITANGTKGTMGEVFANGVIAGFRANSYYDSGATTVKATSAGYSPEIQLRIDNGAIVFNRSTSGATDVAISQAESMRIDNAGNVGIGTSNPVATLAVTSASNARLEVVPLATSSALQSLNSTRTASAELASYGSVLTFNTGAAGSQVEQMRVDGSGNVLIGVNAPSYNSAGRGLIELNGSTDTVIGLRVGGVAKGYLQATATNDILLANQSATGSLGLYTNSVARLVIDSSGNVGVGITAPLAKIHVSSFNAGDTAIRLSSNDTNSRLAIVARSDGTGFNIQIAQESDGSNNKNLVVAAGSTDRVKFTAEGDLLLVSTGSLGYSTGAGATASQLTSKSTAITMNRPTGQITMHNQALAAGATAYFTLVCSSIDTSDILLVNPVGFGSYTVRCNQIISAGNAQIAVTNNSAGSLSEAVVINYAVIKGSSD